MGPLLRLGISLFVFVLICAVAKKCDRKFDLHLEKIILSESSEQNGAVFLKKITAQSPESCYTTCCEIDRCTVAVYTPKRGKECYLFNCGDPNICNFTSHADYTVFMLQQPKQHPARTSEPPTTALVTAADSRQKGTLHGRCGPAVPCTDENTICDSGLCICQAGWIEKMHTCVRSVCKKPNLQFQCNDGSACIAIYDVCNGIAECRDESDEVGCDESDVLRKYTSVTADRTPTARKAADNSSHPASPPKLDHPPNRLMHDLYRQRKQERSEPAEKTRTAASAASTAVSDARPGDFLYDLDASSIENELHSLRTGRRRHGTARSGSINNLAEHSTYEEILPRSRRPASVWRLDDPPVEEEAGDSDLSPFLMRLVDGGSKNRQHRLENLLDAYGPVPSLLQHQRFPSLAAIPKEGEEEEESAVEPPGRRRRFLRPPPPAVLTAPPKSRGFRLHPLLERYARARFLPPSEEEEPVEEGEALMEPSATGTMAVLPRSHLPRQHTALPYRGRSRRRGHGVAFYEENEPTTKNGVRETEMSGGTAASDDTARAVESKSIADGGGGGGGVSFTSSFAARNRTQWHIAAILLAVGLGLISCLFGFLVGRCRKDTCGGARSKAVAASRLRRRIRDSRQAAAAAAGLGSDLEKNGLLTGLQL
nr:unnamed protein product [Spirometra erinaceieuropaei]